MDEVVPGVATRGRPGQHRAPVGVATAMGELGADGARVFGDNPSYAASMGQAWFTPPVSQPEDIAAAVLFLASDDSRTMTGVQLPVDHGATKV
ncbi:hypothetical protein ASG36_19875 [Geodermatophilus sp. Leaf369]|nr:hypothetical protein ASG36_19875 [Geodermatophilus sp. Leaf369]